MVRANVPINLSFVAVQLADEGVRQDARGRACSPFENSFMSSHNDTTSLPPPLDLSGWRRLPAGLMAVGAVLSVIGAAMNPAEFGFSWLLAFMFFLSIALGALFLVMVH